MKKKLKQNLFLTVMSHPRIFILSFSNLMRVMINEKGEEIRQVKPLRKNRDKNMFFKK